MKDKDSEIINRHIAAMFSELEEAGLKPIATLAFVVFDGGPDKFDFNIATTGVEHAFKTTGPSPDEQRAELMAYVAAQLVEQVTGSPSRHQGVRRVRRVPR